MLQFSLPDGSVKEFPEGTTGLQIAESIGPRLAQQAIGVKVGETVYDLSRPLSEGGALRVITPKNDDPDALMLLRHSCAHVLAEAICDLFPGTRLAYGPAIENGFYYDLSTPRPLSEEDYERILSGIELSDGEVRADELEYIDAKDKRKLGIEIHSGKNRIVRRIFETLGYNVKALDRVYFAGLTKKGLKKGEWRFLTEGEANILKMGAYV